MSGRPSLRNYCLSLYFCKPGDVGEAGPWRNGEDKAGHCGLPSVCRVGALRSLPLGRRVLRGPGSEELPPQCHTTP